jgi:hypothetical protein
MEFSIGASEEEVLAALGPYDQRFNGPFHDGRENAHWISYNPVRRFLFEARILIWFQDGRVSEIDAVPGFDIPFESGDWLASSAARRGFMAGDLLRQGVLIGEDTHGIATLLGEPDHNSFPHAADALYDLGNNANRLLAQEWLAIQLNDEGLVHKVERFLD